MLKSTNLFRLFLVAVLTISIGSVFATKAYVTNTADNGTGSLRDLIQNSSPGDTLVIDVSGTLNLLSQINVPHDLMITGPGPIHFTINGAGVTAPLEVGFSLSSSSGDFYIEGVRFTGFTQHCIGTGTGYSKKVTLYGCSFENNNTTVLNFDDGMLVVRTCSFINNVSANEAGVCLFSGVDANFVNTTMFNNDASFEGGALNLSAGTVSLTHCTLLDNGATPSAGKAIYINGSDVTFRNNIIYNTTPSDELISFSSGSGTSLGGNVFNDGTNNGFTPIATDIWTSSNPGINASNMITDGFGIKMFPIQDVPCDAIDIDNAPNASPTFDARRSWRSLDGGSYSESSDAGAVEYSPLTITQSGSGSGSLLNVYQSIYQSWGSSYTGKPVFVFEINSGSAPFIMNPGTAELAFSINGTIINGFSQNGSRIPGPGTTPGSLTPAITPVEIQNSQSSVSSAIRVGADDCIIAGVSIGGFNSSMASAIRVEAKNAQIVGCNLGVNMGGTNSGSLYSSTYGVYVLGLDVDAAIGSGSYCGRNHHSSRNVISGNSSAQVRIESPATMKISNNIIGLDGLGMDAPAGSNLVSDTGIVADLYSNTPGPGLIIGSTNIYDRNVIGDQTVGIALQSQNNKLYNNFIGSDFTGNSVNATTSNEFGVLLHDPKYSGFVQNNFIGDIDKGNVVVGNTFEGIKVMDVSYNKIYSNKIGLGVDGVTLLGNAYSGVFVTGYSAVDNEIGAPNKGNIIGDNSDGILLTNSANHTVIRSNIIGLGIDTLTLAANFSGIFVENFASYNKIGGCAFGEGNIIGNNDDGIVFAGSGADYDTVVGNYIGVDLNGNDIGNSISGIAIIDFAGFITIGDIAGGCGNEIAFNTKGIVSNNFGGDEIFVSGNSFHDNVDMAIDWDDDNVVSTLLSNQPNTNNGAIAPILVSATDCGGANLNLELYFDEDATVQLEIFKASDGEQGDSLIARMPGSFIAGNPQTISLPGVPAGTAVVVTATYDYGNGYKSTSEFSVPITVSLGTVPSVSIDGLTDVCSGGIENYSVIAEPGASYFWGFPTELPGEYSVVNNITYYVNQTSDTLFADFSSSYNGGSSDTLVVLADLGGCTNSDTIFINVIEVPFTEGGFGSSPTTCGGTDGYIVYAIGLGSYDIYYNNGTLITATANGSGDVFINGLSQGTYSVDSIASAGFACMLYLTDTFQLADPLPPTIAMGNDVSICESNFATITATGGGSSGPFTYLWDNGAGLGQTLNVSPVTTTIYTCNVTDDVTNCSNSDILTVTVFALPAVNSYLDSVVCIGDGVFPLSASPSGGVWSGTGISGSSFDPVSSGTGTFTITYSYTDANSCSNFDDKIITVNAVPNEGNPVINDVTCFGGSDGAITIFPAGVYGYNWTGPGTYSSISQDISGLIAGSYNLIMTDGDGCIGTYSVNLNEPPTLPTQSVISSDLLCNGDASGSISVSSLSGVSPFLYSIDAGVSFQTSSLFNNLISGTYVVQLKDANGCYSQDTTIIVGEPSELIAVASVTSNYNGAEISCNGFSDGELTGSVSGGQSGYAYDWQLLSSSVGGSTILSNASAGAYEFIVTDGNGCKDTAAVTISEPLAITTVVNVTSPSCLGYSDGQLESVPSGGTGNYVFDWYNDAWITWVSSSNPFITSAGTYWSSVTDDNGCMFDFGPHTMNDAIPFSVLSTSTDETCFGLSDGILDTISTSGGTKPFSIQWEEVPSNTPAGSTSPVIGVGIGDYVGILTDANGCEARDTVTILSGESYNPAIIEFSNDSCVNTNSYDFADDSNVPSSGAASFDWVFPNATPATSNAQLPSGIKFDQPGLHEVIYTVTSNNGCIFKDTTYVSIVDTASLFVTPTNISCFGYSDGSVVADALGGNGTYTYSFNGGAFSAIDNITGLTAGVVTIVVEDGNGCQSAVQSINIIEPAAIDADTLVVNTSCGLANGSVEAINIVGGAGNYTIEWFGDPDYITSLGNNNPVGNLSSQTYYLIITDISGCSFYGSADVGNNGASVPTPSIDQIGPLLICEDGSGNFGQLTATSNDVSPGTFNWYVASQTSVYSTGTSLTIDNGVVGDHYVYVTENNGFCDSPADSILLDYQNNDAVVNSLIEFCLGDEVSIDITTAGLITWYNSNGEIADTASANTTALPIIIPTTYYFTIDLNNCFFYDSLVLTEDPDCDGVTIINNAFSPDGDGVNDRFIIDANALLTNENKVIIINRWGDIIREFNNYNNDDVAWDGTSKSGENVPNGTYFYVVEIPAMNLKKTGWIQVIR